MVGLLFEEVNLVDIPGLEVKVIFFQVCDIFDEYGSLNTATLILGLGTWQFGLGADSTFSGT